MLKKDELEKISMVVKVDKEAFGIIAPVYVDFANFAVFVERKTFSNIRKKEDFRGVDVRVGGKDLIMLTNMYIFKM